MGAESRERDDSPTTRFQMASTHVDDLLDDLYGGSNASVPQSLLYERRDDANATGLQRGSTASSSRAASRQRGAVQIDDMPDNVVPTASAADAFTRSQQIRAVEESTQRAHVASLLPHERLAITREIRVRAKHEERQKQFAKFRTHIAKKLGRAEDELVVTHAEEFRGIQEELDIIQRAKALDKERDGADGWAASLRNVRNYCSSNRNSLAA